MNQRDTVQHEANAAAIEYLPLDEIAESDGDGRSREVTAVQLERPKPRSGRPVRVATWLSPAERARVDAAGFGVFTTLHHDRPRAVFEDIRHDRADAAIVSLARVSPEYDRDLAALASGFPERPVVGLALDVSESEVMVRCVALGFLGVTAVVDARTCHGWRKLRTILAKASCVEKARPALLRAIRRELDTLTDGCWKFFNIALDPSIAKSTEVARRLHVLPSTMISRFRRAELPSPKRYCLYARLTRAAYLGEAAGLSCGDIAFRMQTSSPQSFCRTVRMTTGLAMSEFRYRYAGSAMVEKFIRELIQPHKNALRYFDPGIRGGTQQYESSAGNAVVK